MRSGIDEQHRTVWMIGRIPVRFKRLSWRREFPKRKPSEVSQVQHSRWRQSGRRFPAQVFWGSGVRPRIEMDLPLMLWAWRYDTDQIARVLTHEAVHAALQTHRASRRAEKMWNRSPSVRRAARPRVALLLARWQSS